MLATSVARLMVAEKEEEGEDEGEEGNISRDCLTAKNKNINLKRQVLIAELEIADR